MQARANNLKPESSNVQEGGDGYLPIDVPLSAPALTSSTTVEGLPIVDGTPIDDSGTLSEDPHDDVA